MSDSDYFAEVAAYEEGVHNGQLSELDTLEEFVGKLVKMLSANSTWSGKITEREFADYINSRREWIKGTQ